MITVIIPARDAEKTIGECLRAVMDQEEMQFGTDYEVILVDDGSIDQTVEIAESFSVRVIQQSNAGPAAARNHGAMVAAGSILVFTDSDCAPSSGWLKNLTQPLSDPQIVGVKGAYLTHQVKLVPRFVQLEYAYKDTRMSNLSSIDFIDTYSAAYRKDVFLQNGGFDERFLNPAVEDIEFSFRLARKGYRLLFEPKATVFHYHDRNLVEYLQRKFKIGYWGAYMLGWTSEKMLRDSHTAPTQRLEIILVATLLITLPFLVIWPIYAAEAFFAILVLFLIMTTPFQAFIRKRDPQVLWIASIMLIARAGALGMGLFKGFLQPPKTAANAFPCQSIWVRAIKRLLDVLGAAIGLILSAPLIGIAALAVHLDSKGPIIFKQPRAGEFGRAFTIYKLRTMVEGADQMVEDVLTMSQLKGPAFKIANDPRVTRVGRYLRRWSLDELPQFWNVLKGDMSLVGPRPEVMRIVESYNDEQRERLMVRPGLTGPVQVNGRGGLDFDQRFKLELDYLRNYSLLEDMKIILKTFSAILSGEGIG
jgi:lipopolysaccharide/colanic/teichoic acid biosynthesis glycosyltransferase/glycosyltransferase involved in cell wall biosynthesis